MPRKSENATGESLSEAASEAASEVATLRAELAALAAQIAGLVAEKSAAVGSAVGAGIGERARQGVAQVSAQVAGTVSGAASGLVDEFRAASTDSLARLADGVAERTREVSETFLDALSSEVRRNPARTLAVTLGLGLILGAWSRSGARSGH